MFWIALLILVKSVLLAVNNVLVQIQAFAIVVSKELILVVQVVSPVIAHALVALDQQLIALVPHQVNPLSTILL
jgi:hypothetical protein